MLNRAFTLMLLAIVAAGLVLTGCGPKPIQKESILDTPDNHYSQGLRKLKVNDLESAAEEFNRATALSPDYPGGYVGMGLILAEKGDYIKAIESVEKGLGKDNKFGDGYIAKGRILTKQKKGEDWLKDAVKEFDKALKINPNSESAMFYMGEAYKEAYQFMEAANWFSKVIAMKGDFAEEANDEWELVQKIMLYVRNSSSI